MNTKLGKVVIAVAAALLAGSAAIAQNMQEVTVQAKRLLPMKVTERIEGGIPIQDISVTYGVSASDLDLASYAGAMALQKRVQDAAKLACKEISRQYPDATPSESDCAKTAAEKAMPQVKQLVASAEQAHKKG